MIPKIREKVSVTSEKNTIPIMVSPTSLTLPVIAVAIGEFTMVHNDCENVSKIPSTLDINKVIANGTKLPS